MGTPSAINSQTNLQERLRTIRDALTESMVERDTEVRLVLLALLAGEHVLLLGPPGTGKSMLAKSMSKVLTGSKFFERLLTKFSTPDEVFGPLSIQALEEDRYCRKTEGYLPNVHVAFIDEIFKANSAILNSMLTVMNERQFDNDGRRIEVPLISMIGASNELPESEELDALYDRFLVRMHVGPTSADGIHRLLTGAFETLNVAEECRLSSDDLAEVREYSRAVELRPSVLNIAKELRGLCESEGIRVSDRRWMKAIRLLKVAAYTAGRHEVTSFDASLLPHMLWERPEQLAMIQQWYEERAGMTSVSFSGIEKHIQSLERRAKKDTQAQEAKKDDDGEQLYIDYMGRETREPRGERHKTRDGENLYYAKMHKQLFFADAESDREYTIDELNELTIRGRQYGDFQGLFEDYPARSSYLSTKMNKVLFEGDNPPVLVQKRFSTAYVDNQAEEIQSLRRELEVVDQNTIHTLENVHKVFENCMWLDPARANPIESALKLAHTKFERLDAALREIKLQFESLPTEEGGEQ